MNFNITAQAVGTPVNLGDKGCLCNVGPMLPNQVGVLSHGVGAGADNWRRRHNAQAKTITRIKH